MNIQENRRVLNNDHLNLNLVYCVAGRGHLNL
jgi:hypothetical protein